MKSSVHADSLKALAARIEQNSFAHGHVAKLSQAASALHEIVANHNLGESAAQRARRVEAASGKFRQLVERVKIDTMLAEVQGYATLNAQRAERLDLRMDQFANDIARAFGVADQQEKTRLLDQITTSCDGRSMAALLAAPAYVTGVEPDVLARFIDYAENKHAPDLHAKRQAFAEDLQAAATALRVAQGLAHEADNSREAAKIGAAEEAVLAAENQLAQAAE